MGRQHKRAPQIEPEMLPTPALTDRFKGLGLRPLSRPRASSRDGHPCIELAGAMVHLSWPLRAYMSGGGCLPGGVAAGLLHLLGAREIPENRARLPLRPVLRSPPARRPIAFRLTFCPRGPCPFYRSPLLGFRPLLGSPPHLLASVRICARNLVSSLSLKPHVDFLGARREGFFLEGTATGSRLLLCLGSASLFAT